MSIHHGTERPLHLGGFGGFGSGAAGADGHVGRVWVTGQKNMH